MDKFVIVQSGRYGDGWKGAPERITIEGGDTKLAQAIADYVQLWGWPGQEDMFVLEEDFDQAYSDKCASLLKQTG